VIEVGYGMEECAGRTILQGMRNELESFSSECRTRTTDMTRRLVAATTAAVLLACSAVPDGTEEAVIRAALVGMALVLLGTTLAVVGTAVVVIGTAAAGMVGVVVGIMVVTVAAGELAPQ